jgi:hypothetical protein
MGLYNAIGIEVANLDESALDTTDPVAMEEHRKREKAAHLEQQRYRERKQALRALVHVWLPDEPCSSVLLSPADARKLVRLCWCMCVRVCVCVCVLCVCVCVYVRECDRVK